MQLIVQLRPELATEFHKQPLDRGFSEASRYVRVAVKNAGCSLSPLHPGASDPNLVTYFQVEAPNRETAELLQHQLAACDGVEAAYVKPADEMP